MASTYGNDLRLEEIGDGEQSGTWGATTNTNLELISEALSFGTEAITTNADTHTTTIADGATDPGRSLYLKYTGTLDSTCTITIAPNSISKTWYIENGTSGSQSIIISQGSGANVTIPTGQTKIVYSDGAGSSAAMAEIGTLGVTNLAVTTNATIGGNVDIDGTTNLDAVDIDGAVQLDATLTVGANDQGYDVTLHGDTAARNVKWDSSADSLIFTDNTKAVFGTGSDASILFDGTDMKVGATAGHLDLFTSEVGSSVRILGSGESLAEFTDDGDVDLFHNGTLKMSTTATGITVAGAVVDNLTRGSIKVGNSSGVFAELTKGGAATVLTSDGTDLSWAEAGGGGGEQEFVASGAVGNGAIVGLNPNGTVSVMQASYYAAANVDTAGRVFDTYASFDPDTGKILVTYERTNTNGYPCAVVGTVSGTSISFGTPVVIASDNYSEISSVYDTAADKLLLFAFKSGIFSGYVGTVSGTTTSWGSKQTIINNSGGNYCDNGTCCFDSNAGKAVVGYRNYKSSLYYGYAIVISVSGNNLSGGTETIAIQIAHSSPTLTQGGMVFDSSANKILYCGATTDGKVAIGTVSGTNISFGTPASVQSTTISSDRLVGVFCGGSINKTLLTYHATTCKAVVCSISGTTPSFGTAATDSSTSNVARFPTFDPDTGRVFIITEDGSLKMTPVFVVGTACGIGVPVTIVGASTYGNNLRTISSAYDTTNDKMVLFHGTNNTASGSVSAESRIINTAAPDFIGVAAAAISSGATGKVTVVSGVNEGQSGLSIGAPYGYDSANGNLVLGGNNVFGKAIAADKLFITKGTA